MYQAEKYKDHLYHLFIFVNFFLFFMKKINKKILKKILKKISKKKNKKRVFKTHNDYYNKLYSNYINAILKNSKEVEDKYDSDKANRVLNDVLKGRETRDYYNALINNQKLDKNIKNQFKNDSGYNNVIRFQQRDYENMCNRNFNELNDKMNINEFNVYKANENTSNLYKLFKKY